MLTDFADGYQHIGIPTDDMEATEKFYTSLGFRLKWETVNNGFPVKFFEHGNVLIETYLKEGGAAGAIGAIDHIALNCTDIVGCVRQAKEEGWELREGPAYLPYWDHGVVFITLLGPSREIVEFIQQFDSEEQKNAALSALQL